MNIVQKGNDNYIHSASQAGSDHVLQLTFRGNHNGRDAFAHTETSDVAAAGGLSQGDAIQAGSGNSLNVTFTGNHNSFAFGQFGPGDVITGQVNGSSNEVALLQDGASLGGNLIDFKTTGNDNALGVEQTGQSNTVTSTQNGTANVGSLMQGGYHNVATVTQ
jgi:hypothetical protein